MMLSSSPPSLTPFEKAVAGSTPFLFAQDFPGKVFKPAHIREKAFYDSLERHHALKRLVPKYYGTVPLHPSSSSSSPSDAPATEEGAGTQYRDSISAGPADIHPHTDAHSSSISAGEAHTHTPSPTEYIVLEDLTHGFIHPCILDVKLGITHHDLDLTSPRPIAPLRKSKYLTVPTLGYCLTGMQVYKAHTSEFEYMDKAEGRDLTEQTIAHKLLYFFHNGLHLREDVIGALLQRLHQIAKYFEEDPGYQFRSTSLLLIYEGQPGADTRVDARMIDFAHATQIMNKKYKDEYGYLFGTRNLIRMLENLPIRSPPALL